MGGRLIIPTLVSTSAVITPSSQLGATCGATGGLEGEGRVSYLILLGPQAPHRNCSEHLNVHFGRQGPWDQALTLATSGL